MNGTSANNEIQGTPQPYLSFAVADGQWLRWLSKGLPRAPLISTPFCVSYSLQLPLF